MKKDQWIVGLNSKYSGAHTSQNRNAEGFRIPSDLFPLSTNPAIVSRATSHITYHKPTQETTKYTQWASDSRPAVSKYALNSLIQSPQPPITKEALAGLIQPMGTPNNQEMMPPFQREALAELVQPINPNMDTHAYEYVEQPTSNFPQKPVMDYWYPEQNKSRVDIQPHPPRLTWWQQLLAKFPFLNWKCLLLSLFLLCLLGIIAYLANRKEVVVQYVPKPVTIVKEQNPFYGHPELTCPEPYFLLNNVCIKCPKFSYWNGKICVLPPKIKKPVPVFIAKVITNSSGQFVVSNETVKGEKGFTTPGIGTPIPSHPPPPDIRLP